MSFETAAAPDVALRVDGVSKHYLMYDRPEDRLKQMILPRLARLGGREGRSYFREFAALRNVSLTVNRGETVGIIGRNGSGKSTLLQIICGTLAPSSGSVEVRGRIAALLELGAGFNPEFTGRENVYMNGSILGLGRQEIDARYDSILAFADIGPFIDQPVKTYSSGMYVRLAFAVAINVDPAILVVDEALAVGDEAFQRKCFARIEQIKEAGATVLFVSHGAQTIVQLCDRAVLMDAGELILEGKPKAVVGQYQKLVNANDERAAFIRSEILHTFSSERVQPKAAADVSHAASTATDDTERHHNQRIESSAASTSDDVAMTATIEAVQTAAAEADYYDADFKSESMIEMDPHRARISDVKVTALGGQQVNVLRIGRRYQVCFSVEVIEELENAGFGISIRTISGVILAGNVTDKTSSGKMPKLKAGSIVSISFEIANTFLPSTYFINAAVFGSVDGERSIQHRILDATVFRVAAEPELTATGFFDLNAISTFSTISIV